MALVKNFDANNFSVGDVSSAEIGAVYQWNTKGYPGNAGNPLVYVDADPFGDGDNWFRVINEDYTLTNTHTFQKAVRSLDQTTGLFYDEIWQEWVFRTDSNYIHWNQSKMGPFWGSELGAASPGTNPTGNTGKFDVLWHSFSPNNSKVSALWPTVNPSGTVWNDQQQLIGLDTYAADTRQTAAGVSPSLSF